MSTVHIVVGTVRTYSSECCTYVHIVVSAVHIIVGTVCTYSSECCTYSSGYCTYI